MDQNQLSAYVQQDSFPLFVHGANDFSSEFCELLRKTLSEHVTFDATFADNFYSETSGHPFLTVKVAVLLFDWLIENRRPVNRLHLTGDDFNQFAKDKLTAKSIALAAEYDFFRHAISEALGSSGRQSTPWLHSVYSVIKQIAMDNPRSYRCTYDEFIKIVDALEMKDKLGFSAEYLLTTGIGANFLYYNNKYIGPKIKILGRISQITIPKVVW